MRIVIVIVALSLSACTKQIDHLLGNDEKHDACQDYPWLCKQEVYTPEFCSHWPSVCHDKGVAGY